MPWNTKVLDSQGLIKTEQEGVFTPNNPTDYVPRVTGVAGWGMDSAFGTAKKGETTARIRIQRVTTTSDGTGAGTLREALALPDTTRTVIVFDVSGWHVIGGNTLTIDNGNKTLAFNTAPSPGYYIRDGEVRVKANDVLLWHLGCGHGGPYDGTYEAIGLGTGATNVALINCAGWFGADDIIDFIAGTDYTIYNTVIAHGLSDGVGTKMRGTLFEDVVTDVTFTRSMYLHCRARCPLFDGARMDFFNNIIGNFDAGSGAIQVRDNGATHDDNYQHNVFVQGPDTTNNRTCLIAEDTDGGGFGGSIYYPTSLNKYIGTLNEFDNDGGVTLSGSPRSNAIAHGSNVTAIDGWTDAEAIDRITNNMGPRPADRLPYIAALRAEVINMEDGTGDTGSLADTDPLNGYNVGGSAYDTLASNSGDIFDDMDNANIFDNATLVDSGTNYRVYDFDVTDGLTDLDIYLNDTVNDGVMNAGWKT